MLEKKKTLFIHCSTWDTGLHNTPYRNKPVRAQQIMLHNTLEYKSSLLCIAWVWAEISSITINTVCLHEGTAQRDVCLQIHLSNTADMTDRRAVRWQMPARWWPSCRTCSWWQERKKKNGGLAKTGSNKQLNGWTDGQLVTLNTFHIPLRYFLVFVFPCCHLSVQEQRKQDHFPP